MSKTHIGWRGAPSLNLKPQHVAAAAVLLGFALRFLCLGSKSIWLDEGLSIRAARLDWETYISGSIERFHPPLFFIILRQFMKLGMSEIYLRLPAAIAGGLSVSFAYHLSRKVFDQATAISVAWFAALSPLLIWYSQEIRGYSLLVMLALLSLFALAQVTLRRGPHWWLLFVAAITAGMYTHYAFILTLPVEIAVVTGLLASKNGTRWAPLAMLTGWTITGLLFQPWLETPAASSFIDQLQSDRLYYNMLTAGRLTLPADLNYIRLVQLLALAGVALLVLGTFLLYRLLRRRGAWILKLRDHPVIRGLCVALFILVLIISVVPRGYTLKRYTHVLWFLVPVTFGWVWPWSSRNKTVLKALLPLALLASLINVLLIPKAQWKQAARFILANQNSSDVVMLVPYWMEVPFGYYSQESIDLAGMRPQDNTSEKIATIAGDHGRIWLLYHIFDADPRQVDTIRQWLEENATEVQNKSYFRLQLYLYQTN